MNQLTDKSCAEANGYDGYYSFCPTTRRILPSEPPSPEERMDMEKNRINCSIYKVKSLAKANIKKTAKKSTKEVKKD